MSINGVKDGHGVAFSDSEPMPRATQRDIGYGFEVFARPPAVVLKGLAYKHGQYEIDRVTCSGLAGVRIYTGLREM